MVDLDETNNPERRPQIDTWVGYFWPLLSLSAAAAMVAYEAKTMVANSSVSHIVAR